MTWETIYRDTNQLIERNSENEERVTWINPDGLAALAARVAAIESHLWPAPDTPADPGDAEAFADVWPSGGLVSEGGVVYRNISGVPLTSPPSGFPGTADRWSHLFVVALAPVDPDPEPGIQPWVQPLPGVQPAYPLGSKVTHAGHTWTSNFAGDNVWKPGEYGWTDNGAILNGRI